MQPTRSPIPQLGPVLVLQALLTEHPELPPMHWSLDADGRISGSLGNTDRLNDLPGVSLRTVIEAYARALGTVADEPTRYGRDGKHHVSQHIRTTWRGVPLHLAVFSKLSAYPELLAVAA